MVPTEYLIKFKI